MHVNAGDQNSLGAKFALQSFPGIKLCVIRFTGQTRNAKAEI